MNKSQQQTLALAAILQTTTLVQQLASTGTCNVANNQSSLRSLITNSDDVENIFTSAKELETGINAIKTIFNKRSKHTNNIVLYSLILINLEKKLTKNKVFVKQITNEINTIKKQQFFAIDHVNSVARLAHLYRSTIGNLKPRIMVSGKQIYLTNEHIINHIRGLLLSGIRAVSLWKLQGGKIWHLFLNKRKILKFINSIDF